MNKKINWVEKQYPSSLLLKYGCSVISYLKLLTKWLHHHGGMKPQTGNQYVLSPIKLLQSEHFITTIVKATRQLFCPFFMNWVFIEFSLTPGIKFKLWSQKYRTTELRHQPASSLKKHITGCYSWEFNCYQFRYHHGNGVSARMPISLHSKLNS